MTFGRPMAIPDEYIQVEAPRHVSDMNLQPSELAQQVASAKFYAATL